MEDKFNYFPLGKTFEKQRKTIEDRGKIDILKTSKPKEIEAIENKSGHKERHLKYKEVFNEVSNERIG